MTHVTVDLYHDLGLSDSQCEALAHYFHGKAWEKRDRAKRLAGELSSKLDTTMLASQQSDGNAIAAFVRYDARAFEECLAANSVLSTIEEEFRAIPVTRLRWARSALEESLNLTISKTEVPVSWDRRVNYVTNVHTGEERWFLPYGGSKADWEEGSRVQEMTANAFEVRLSGFLIGHIRKVLNSTKLETKLLDEEEFEYVGVGVGAGKQAAAEEVQRRFIDRFEAALRALTGKRLEK